MFEWSNGAKVSLPLAMLVIIILTIVLTLFLKNKPQKIRNIPFIVIAGAMLIMEVVKQILAIRSTYSYWSIPLHFCSLFMLWFSLAAFGKGKLQKIGFTLSVVSGYLFLVTFYVNPHSIIGYSTDNILASFSSFHTFTYHHLIILFTFLSITLKQFNPQFNQIKWTSLAYTIYFIIAVAMAHALQTNYVNLLENNISILQHINVTYGVVVYSLTMYIIGVGGTALGIIISKLIYNAVHKSKQKKENLKTTTKGKN